MSTAKSIISQSGKKTNLKSRKSRTFTNEEIRKASRAIGSDTASSFYNDTSIDSATYKDDFSVLDDESVSMPNGI